MRRREVLTKVTAGVAAAGALWGAAPLRRMLRGRARASVVEGPRVLLTGPEGTPFQLSQLKPHEPWVFLYPYVSTPNLLVDLGMAADPVEVRLPDGTVYRWPGGIGPGRSVVAFCSICPHAYSFLRRDVGMIGYRAPEGARGPRIVCCVHLSVFDAAAGGEVRSGPAPHALAAVKLEYEETTGRTYAVGLLGNPHFEDFFKAQASALREIFRPIARARVEVDQALVIPYSEYTRRSVDCPAGNAQAVPDSAPGVVGSLGPAADTTGIA